MGQLGGWLLRIVRSSVRSFGSGSVGEQRFGQREVAVWAGDESQFVDRFLDLLKRYNLLPHQETESVSYDALLI